MNILGFYDNGQWSEEQGDQGVCAVGQVMIRAFPPMAKVFAWFARRESFMRVYRPLKGVIVNG